MGKIARRARIEKVVIYTTSDGKGFTGKDALKKSKHHQTDLDIALISQEALQDILRPKVRELFGFNPVLPEEMEDDNNISDKDVAKAYQEEREKLNLLEAEPYVYDDFDEFLETITELVVKHLKPIEKLILFLKKHGIDSHKIVKEQP